MTELFDATSVFRALAPELLLVAGALALLLASVWAPQQLQAGRAEGAERTSAIARFGAVLCLLVALVVAIMWGDGVSGTTDLRIAGDGFRWAMDLVLLMGGAFALLLLDQDQQRSGTFGPETPVLLLLALSGMMVLVAARDLMLVFLGIELMSVAVYVLAGSNRYSGRSAEASIKYFLLGAVASGFLLYGMALMYGASGSTRFVDIAAWIGAHTALSPLFLAGIALVLVGFAFKVAAAPFHVWTPDVYDGAPLPVTAFMSACVKTAAFGALARTMIEVLPAAMPRWHQGVWWLAAVTMIVGNVLALSQRNLVRLLAYSSIAHAGYLLVAVLVGGPAGTSTLVFYTVSYTLATMGAFAVLIAVNAGRDRALTIDDVAGLWLIQPGLAAALSVCLFAFLGMPLVGGMGFFAKWYVLQSALQAPSPQTILAIIVVVTSAVSAAYYLGVVSAMFMRPRTEEAVEPVASPMLRSLIAFSVGTLLILGVYPTPVMNVARRATTEAVSPTDAGPGGPPTSGRRLQTAESVAN